MKFKTNFLYNYLLQAPVLLAIERTMECEILSKLEFNRPILDIGCGEGVFANILFDEKIDLGIDPNGRELERCKQYQGYNELIECFGNNIPKEAGTFNTIFSNSVLEHIEDLDTVLKEAHRLLSTNGRMYVTIPTNLFDKYNLIYQVFSFLHLKTLSEKYRVFFNNFWKHYHYYDKAGWEATFNKSGLKVISYREYNSKSTCLFNDALVPLSLPGFVFKKFTNRWILFPFLRKIWAKMLNIFIPPLILKDLKIEKECGLVFFEIAKK